MGRRKKIPLTTGAEEDVFRPMIEQTERGWKYYKLHPVTTIAWGSISSAAGTPSTDATIDVSQATSIVIQVDSTHASNTSADTDLNVYASPDGTNFDGSAYTSTNFGSSVIKSFAVTPGPYKIRFRVDENASALAYGTARVYMRT